MLRTKLIMTLAAISLSACETTPALQSDGSNDLAGLPLTAEARAEVTQTLARLNDPEMKKFCSDADIEFLKTSFIGYVVLMDEERTAPWSATEQARVAAQMQKFERLGGDARRVSDACDAHFKASVS